MGVSARREDAAVDVPAFTTAEMLAALPEGLMLPEGATPSQRRVADVLALYRAVFLNSIMQAFKEQPHLENLLLDKRFRDAINTKQDAWRRVIAVAIQNGIPTPAFSASLAYYDSYRRERLPANLIQAQRDFFGAHTYERIDKPGIFHTEWSAQTPPAKSPESHKQDEARPSQVVKK